MEDEPPPTPPRGERRWKKNPPYPPQGGKEYGRWKMENGINYRSQVEPGNALLEALPRVFY
ncbi:MAG: hypothetical protein EAZ78_26855 [Oscillatoriales cyanobacterium]|nr:MAG: hypothetical protein EA000_05840 [Oscillatoriales cyanobacterium]TAD93955.1 MAG: hypothetical protein EAZ98_20945 [Oscillatoriales cyanobacterium]TAD98899.1 MAG: hypothetical protein EAZ96_23930 [Oscillatoriales cyanobacterium]TAE96541.1 MAG: hypothetical protein EAZ78_26855 [Oscillatoriales cyanobacterium]TAF42527.1 MAG: hypothetical protein EAZ68_09735 [Oscillatoriales cyanobacterium]